MSHESERKLRKMRSCGDYPREGEKQKRHLETPHVKQALSVAERLTFRQRRIILLQRKVVKLEQSLRPSKC